MKTLFSVSFRTFTVGAVLALAVLALPCKRRARGSTGPTPITDPTTPPVTPAHGRTPRRGRLAAALASGVAWRCGCLRRRRK
ncbi:MAG: hypothetical protein WKG07_11860 [Hymenobacter sp.]